MRIYLYSDAAEKAARYVVTIAPAGDAEFVGDHVPADWKLADGRPKEFPIVFAYGCAEVPDALGRYMVDREIAHRNRVVRRVRQFFDRYGKLIDDVFDEHGNRIFLEGQAH